MRGHFNGRLVYDIETVTTVMEFKRLDAEMKADISGHSKRSLRTLVISSILSAITVIMSLLNN